MKRFWVSWWSGNYGDEGCTKPPFQFWSTGERSRSNWDQSDWKTDLALCAVIDAVSEEAAWSLIALHFPDYESRFSEEQSLNWEPPTDRFPKRS